MNYIPNKPISPQTTALDAQDSRLLVTDRALKREIEELTAKERQPNADDNESLTESVLADPDNFAIASDSAAKIKTAWAKRAAIEAARQSLKPKKAKAKYDAATTILESAPVQKQHGDLMKRIGPPLAEIAKAWVSLYSMSLELREHDMGLLPRFLLFNVTGKKPDRVETGRSVYDVPQTLIGAVQALVLAGRGAGNLTNTDNGSMANKPTIVRCSEDAKAELARFEKFVDETVSATESEPILNRAVEHAIKLALTVSVATNHIDPVITDDAMSWAVKLAWLSTCTMIEETGDRISDNQREADKKRIFGHIKRAGKAGITDGKIGDRCGSIDKRRRDELLADLVSAGRIEERLVQTKGRPRKRYYLI
jgi:hypothetical protein